jgi:malonyl-CoA O-methyltransferase
MAQRLDYIRLKPRRIVEWWSSLGGAGDALRQAYPEAERWEVEPTPAWFARAQDGARRSWWSPRRWRAGIVKVMLESAEVPGNADLVWANMMLHAVVSPPALMTRWHGLLAVDGFVMFSCLGPDSLRELRSLYRQLGWPAPAADFVDMHDLGDMLVNAGFADPVMDQECLTLTWSTPEALLSELRQLGGNVSPERPAGLRTPRWRNQLLQALESLRRSDGRLSLTFEVAYGHAFKASPRVQGGNVSTVSLDEMRAMVRAGRHTG